MDKPAGRRLSAARRALLACALLLSAGTLAAGAPANATGSVLDRLEQLGAPVKLTGQRDFLPPDQAFRIRQRNLDGHTIEVGFDIEPGYYLYRDKFAFSALSGDTAFEVAALPAGEPKEDPEFGRVAIYRHAVAIPLRVTRAPADGVVEIEVRYQGCAEDGICYPPMKKPLAFTLGGGVAVAPPDPAPVAVSGVPTTGLSAADRITRDLAGAPLATTLVTFLGLGLLLSLTPCVFPMVPILSGIIVGQRQPLSTARAFGLSLVYVLAMAATYALAGIVAGLAGHNLQAAFQHPAVIVAFAAVFVALAVSMFGFYELALPAALQSKLDDLSRRQASGSVPGVAVMGALSAIIVGPCVAPPLAGALAYIGQTGSPVVGGLALFALGLGMGIPLLAVGTSAGALLPRAGPWMDRVKQVFGVVFLGVAVWFLERVLPGALTLALWALLALGVAVFLGATTRLDDNAGSARKLAQALGLLLLAWGVMLAIGAASGARDPLAPLAALGRATPAATAPAFTAVKSAADIERELEQAAAAGEAVMLDVYADWCIECKHLEARTFTAPAVRARLADMRLLRADVTANDATDRALLERYQLYGPPAVLFFRAGRERRDERLLGFADAGDFAARLDRVGAAP